MSLLAIKFMKVLCFVVVFVIALSTWNMVQRQSIENIARTALQNKIGENIQTYHISSVEKKHNTWSVEFVSNNPYVLGDFYIVFVDEGKVTKIMCGE